jgi:hypothetical protein
MHAGDAFSRMMTQREGSGGGPAIRTANRPSFENAAVAAGVASTPEMYRQS